MEGGKKCQNRKNKFCGKISALQILILFTLNVGKRKY